MGEGINKSIFVSNYQYIVELGLFFNIPWMKALWHGFTKWRPRGHALTQAKSLLRKESCELTSKCGKGSFICQIEKPPNQLDKKRKG